MARTKASPGAAASASGPHKRKRSHTPKVAAGKVRKAVKPPAEQLEWDEVTDDLDGLRDIDGLLGNQEASEVLDTEARRRIEILREERALQQDLDDLFGL